jgi:hypothetical protein
MNRSTLFLRNLRRLLAHIIVVPSSSIVVTLMMVAIPSSETSFVTRVTRRNILQGDILHSHLPEE